MRGRQKKQRWNSGRLLRFALALALGGTGLWTLRLMTWENPPEQWTQDTRVQVWSDERQEHFRRAGSLRKKNDVRKCKWVKELLKNGKPIGDPLPVPGKDNGNGQVFWLKRPVLHTIVEETGEQVMVLKYNIYSKDPSWTQHTDKFKNTVKVLESIAAGRRTFPRLHGFCPDIDGYHYIVVEYIDFDVFKLPRPQSLAQCVKRASDAISLFVALDEDMHMFLADFKPGQWMARNDGSLVLQDVDDIVPGGSQIPYGDQIEWHKSRIRSFIGMDLEQFDRKWEIDMFPRKQYSIRYDVVNVQMLFNNLGFSWERDCQVTATFRECLKAIYKWTVTVEDDWPSPKQVSQALDSCFTTGTFEKSRRDPAPWRDFAPMPVSEYVPKSLCLRNYDRPESGGKVSRCKHSCCRSKGGDACYYLVADSECDGLPSA